MNTKSNASFKLQWMNITEYEPSLPILQHCPKGDALPFKEKKERKKSKYFLLEK